MEKHKTWESDYDCDATRLETDRDLEKKVINALDDNSLINSSKIKVRVNDRVMYLEGTVLVKKERGAAQKCIRDIFGIKAVINYLTYPYDHTITTI